MEIFGFILSIISLILTSILIGSEINKDYE